ncbi:SRPBCC domain-containing protein [Saccharomonospora cyanea]|uniref:SRPBCC domain-containing protein n=1 Tax=Saccharomonospora cyanea TaxID=40989 RepID=UPI0038CD8955
MEGPRWTTPRTPPTADGHCASPAASPFPEKVWHALTDPEHLSRWYPSRWRNWNRGPEGPSASRNAAAGRPRRTMATVVCSPSPHVR